MIISGSSAKVYNQTLVEIYNQKGDSFGFTINFLKSLIKKIILPFLVVVWFAPEIFSFIFGEKWIEAGYYTQVLSPYILNKYNGLEFWRNNG
jgi:O-antigen/teichoic acid export membrane protein